MNLWDSIQYTSEAFLKVLLRSADDALGYAWRFADIDSGNEKSAWVVSTLISGDDLVDFLVPRLDRLGAFRVNSFFPLDCHELEYTFFACVPD